MGHTNMMGRWIVKYVGQCKDEGVDGQKDGWVDEWVVGLLDVWTNGW